MTNTLNIAKHNLKMFFNNKFSIMLLALPVLVTTLLMFMLSGNKFSVGAQVGIVMSEKVPGIEALLNELQTNISLAYLDEDTALTKLEQKKLNAIIAVRTDNLLANLVADEKSLEVMSITDEPTIAFVTVQLDKALSTVHALAVMSGADETEFERLYADYKSSTGEIKIERTDFEQITATMVFGMFVMVFLFTCIKSLQPMMHEKESKVYERICTSPIKHYEYILGHILGAFSILFIQIIIQGVIMNTLKLTFGLGFVKFIGICMVLGIVGIAISLIILSCSKNTQAYFVTGSFIISPLCMLSDCVFPKELLPEAVNKIMLLSPVRWVMILYKNVMLEASFGEVIMSLGIAIGISVVLILMGIVIENARKII